MVINIDGPSFPIIDVDPVAKAIESVFRLLEPWFGAQCDVPVFDDIIQCIRRQGREYMAVVDLSLKTSEDGIVLAEDALLLCSEIADGKDEITIKSFFEGLLLTATTAHERAEDCRRRFQEIRFNIMRISNEVPKATEGAAKQLASVQTCMARSKVASRALGLIADLPSGGAPGIVGVPPDGLIFPSLLPVLNFVARRAGNFFARNMEERKREELTLEEALKRLESLDQDLERIHNCLGHVVGWWKGIKERLRVMEGEIVLRGISTFKDEVISKTLQCDWNDVKKRYEMYISETMGILDNYKTLYTTESDEMDIGFNGRLLDLQRSAKALYGGLTQLENISRATRGSRNVKLQCSLHLMRDTFLAHLSALLDCLQKLEKSTEGGVAAKILGHRYTMRKTLQNLLNQGNIHFRIFSVELWVIRRIIEKETSRRGIFDTIKLRTSDGTATTESVKETLGRVEEAVQGILGFSVDLALDGIWQEDGTVVGRKVQPSVKDTLHTMEFIKGKLEAVRT